MNDRHFNALTDALTHHLAGHALNRMRLALRVVVEETGPRGAEALEHICEMLAFEDEAEMEMEEVR